MTDRILFPEGAFVRSRGFFFPDGLLCGGMDDKIGLFPLISQKGLSFSGNLYYNNRNC